MNKMYSAAVSGKNKLTVFNAAKGTRAYTINLGANTSIVNGPIITHDKLTVVVKDARNKNVGKVYSLKTGILSYSFSL